MNKEAAELTLEEFRELLKTMDPDTVVSVIIEREDDTDGRE